MLKWCVHGNHTTDQLTGSRKSQATWRKGQATWRDKTIHLQIGPCGARYISAF